MKTVKRFFMVLCILVIALGILAGCKEKREGADKDSKGDETVSDDVKVDTSWYNSSKKTFTLTKASELMGLAELAESNNFKGKTIKLGADIALNKVRSKTITNWRIGSEIPSNIWTPLGTEDVPFAGKIDGKGHTISGLYVDATQNGAGFIGRAATTVELIDIRFEDGYIKNTKNYTGIIGYGLVKRIEKVYTNLIIDTSGVGTGGLIGWYMGGYADKTVGDMDKWENSYMRINECWFDGEIESSGYSIGGCVGGQEARAKVDITNFLSTGKLTCKRGDIYGRVGAIFGWMNYSAEYNLVNCVSTANIKTAYRGSGNMVGALIGDLGANGLTITNCYGVGETVIGRVQKDVELSDDILKTIDEIEEMEISTALPKLQMELISPWKKDKGEAPVLRMLD